ncbi:MAG: tetratricopeptide repeat protein [Deltaproteobacteria bacterium]|nr:tetratricopeptide repeat protein [Deltaproteobacteria bacterium]
MLHSQGLAFLQNGEAPEAQRLADDIKTLVEDSVSLRLVRYADHLLGMKELQAKNYRLAVSHLEKAVAGLYAPEPNFPTLQPLFFSTLAEAYLEAGELDKAAQYFKKVLNMALGRHQAGDIYARCFYGLARVFDQKGEIKQAKEQYQHFLNLWEGGDPGLPGVAEARERLQALNR